MWPSHRCLAARASHGKGLDWKLPQRLEKHTLNAPKEPPDWPKASQVLPWTEPVIPLDQALLSFLAPPSLVPHPHPRPGVGGGLGQFSDIFAPSVLDT